MMPKEKLRLKQSIKSIRIETEADSSEFFEDSSYSDKSSSPEEMEDRIQKTFFANT